MYFYGLFFKKLNNYVWKSKSQLYLTLKGWPSRWSIIIVLEDLKFNFCYYFIG